MAYVGMTGLDENVPSTGGRPLVPEGEYPVEITDAYILETKAGGSRIVVEFSILMGECNGMTVQDSIMIAGNGVDYGRQKAYKLLTALRWENPSILNDTDDLLGGRCWIRVSQKESKSKTTDRVFLNNNIDEYLPFTDAPEPAPEPAAPPWNQGQTQEAAGGDGARKATSSPAQAQAAPRRPAPAQSQAQAAPGNGAGQYDFPLEEEPAAGDVSEFPPDL
jgi:hypothetical protein